MDMFLGENFGIQISMFRDRRFKSRCPDCEVALKKVRSGKIAVYDLPLADRKTV